MDLEQLAKQIADIERDLAARLAGLNTVDAVRGLETSVLGKAGALGALIGAIKEYPAEERGQVGKTVNQAKGKVKTQIDARLAELLSASADAESSAAESIDPTLPGPLGTIAPKPDACVRR